MKIASKTLMLNYVFYFLLSPLFAMANDVSSCKEEMSIVFNSINNTSLIEQRYDSKKKKQVEALLDKAMRFFKEEKKSQVLIIELLSHIHAGTEDKERIDEIFRSLVSMQMDNFYEIRQILANQISRFPQLKNVILESKGGKYFKYFDDTQANIDVFIYDLFKQTINKLVVNSVEMMAKRLANNNEALNNTVDFFSKFDFSSFSMKPVLHNDSSNLINNQFYSLFPGKKRKARADGKTLKINLKVNRLRASYNAFWDFWEKAREENSFLTCCLNTKQLSNLAYESTKDWEVISSMVDFLLEDLSE